ncbi:MAG: hypothetical protein ABI729_08475, partial [Chitinophagales bacterium]
REETRSGLLTNYTERTRSFFKTNMKYFCKYFHTTDFLVEQEIKRAISDTNYENAINICEKNIALGIDKSFCYQAEASVFYKSGKFPEMLTAAKYGLAVNRTDCMNYGNLAAALLKTNDFKNGLKYADTCIQMCSDYGKGYLIRGQIKLKLNDPSGGCIDLEHAKQFGAIADDSAIYSLCK